MSYSELLSWWLVGIIMLTITIFVHKHTYERTPEWRRSYFEDYKDCKYPFPRWLLLIMVIVSALPLVNAIGFGIGIVFYGIALSEKDIVFSCKSKWWGSFMEFLNKEV